jgi:hypothetical protein
MLTLAEARFSPCGCGFAFRVGARRLKSGVSSIKKESSVWKEAGFRELNMKESVKDISNAFREARIASEKLLEQGRITWERYAIVMIGFEEKLKSMRQVI